MATDIDELQISVTADTKDAVKAYKDLAKALKDLNKMSKSDFGFANLSRQVKLFSKNTRGAIADVERLANALERIKTSSRVLTNLKAAEKIMAEAQKQGEIPEAPQNGTAVIEEGDSSKLAEATDGVNKLDKEVEKLNKTTKRANTTWGRFIKNIGNIIKYRIVRSILSGIAKAAKEGSENLYTFLNAADSENTKKMKASLDSISSSFEQLKNTLGITSLSLMAGWEPVLNGISAALIEFTNALNIAIALIKREDTYLKANKETIKRWSESVNSAVQGFDELNVLAGTGGTNPFDMFEEEKIDSDDILLMVKEASILGTVIALMATLAQKVKALTGGYKNKNTALDKQTQKTTADAKATEGLFETVAELAVGVGGAVAAFELFDKILAPDTVTDFSDVVEGLGDTVGELDPSPIDNLGLAFDSLKEKAETKIGEVTGLVGNIGTAFDEIKNNVEANASETAGFIQGITDKVKGFGEELGINASGIKTWQTDAKKYAQNVQSAFATMVNTSNSKLGSLITKITEVKNAYKEMLGVMGVQTSTESASSTIGITPGTKTNLPPILSESEGVENLYSPSASQSTELGTTIGHAMAETLGIEGTLKGTIFSAIQDAFLNNSFASGLFSVADKVSGDIKQSFPEAFENAMNDLFRIIASWYATGGATSFAGGFASGGFVSSGEVFTARENGIPEMVGRIGNRTAVANNDQITDAIASAVYDAMTSANNGANVNVTLEGDAKKMFKVVQNEARNYTKATGNYAW